MITELERQTLRSAICRVLPSGDGPGASDADAHRFVEWLIRQPAFSPRLACLRSGLALLESTAVAQHGASFHTCAPPLQDAVLRQAQRTPHRTIQGCFATLARVTVAGFLCPPEYFGNRDAVGWSYIGYSPTPSRR